MGLIYSGSECVIEKYRAKHDKWNATYAGCATGAAIAHSGNLVFNSIKVFRDTYILMLGSSADSLACLCPG